MASAPSNAPPRARKAQLARELGVSRQAIGDLVSRGILSEDKDGLIDVEMAKLAVANRVRPSGKTAQALTGAPTTAPNPGASIDDEGAGAGETAAPTTPGSQVSSYHVAKTLNEAAQAEMNQMKVKEAKGELIRVAAVEAVWGAALAGARETLLQLRARLAPLLAAETDAFKIEQMLDEEHSKALAAMAGADPRKARR